MTEQCGHDHDQATDPLLAISAHWRPIPGEDALLHVVLDYCPALSDAHLAAITGALSRTLGDLQAGALASLAQGN